MTYIVIEIQNNSDGSVGTILNTYSDRNTAEQQYHLILASAAVSQLPVHAAVMLTDDGRMVTSQAYRHEEPEPEPEPEPEVVEGE